MGRKRAVDDVAFLSALNPAQREAVLCTDGPVLILAGAGSGKTRVLTYRVAYLLKSRQLPPWQIMAVTFTNKAAEEMRNRILELTNGAGTDAWIGTFHSLCARILRVEAERLGFGRNFSIFDREDQLRFIRAIMAEMGIPTQDHTPSEILNRISAAKNDFVSPAEYEKIAVHAGERTAAQVYRLYQHRLKENNVMDFDDLLVNPLILFDEHPEVLEKYQERFRYVLVDEFQDTNRTQYLFVKKLVARHQNLCVVGDDDQSIYRWRGADIRNILELEKDFPQCQVFRLEQNYRSTRHILEAANSVVAKNRHRRPKTLWTEKEAGEKVVLFEVETASQEALTVVDVIKEELTRNSRDFSSFAVLYRTNAQSRVLEEALRVAGIPYKIVGGLRFYERKEVKDVLAYLRLICNPKDSVSFKRVVNFPLRAIGEVSVRKLEAFAREQNLSLMEAAARVEEIDTIASRTRAAIASFYELIDKYASLKEEFSAGELARALVDEIGLLKMFKEINTPEAEARADNVRELLHAIEAKTMGQHSLDEFLEEVSLLTDIDNWDDRANAVTLMTLHSAKGLEFPVVFITGLEEGLFPLSRSLDDPHALEEERRLFYVGATRAKERLYLSWAARRQRFGEDFHSGPSLFLNEIQPDLVERRDLRRRDAAERNQPSRSRYKRQPRYDDHSQVLPQLYVGCEISHERFGVGRITKVEGRGEAAKITVNFYEEGIKKLVVKYANVQVLD